MRDYTTATDGPTLHDVVNGDLAPPPEGETVEYEGFHISQQYPAGTFHVQYDGHAGKVFEFEDGDYNDVTELVKDLNRHCLIRLHEYDYQDDKEGLVEWAGKIMTSDKDKAEERPDLYLHIPDDVLEG